MRAVLPSLLAAVVPVAAVADHTPAAEPVAQTAVAHAARQAAARHAHAPLIDSHFAVCMKRFEDVGAARWLAALNASDVIPDGVAAAQPDQLSGEEAN